MANKKSVEEINRQRQQRRIDEKHLQEAEARPDARHRAIMFLLDQIILNNRDARREAEYHKRSLDELLGNKEKLAEVEGRQEPSAVDLAEEAEQTPIETPAPQQAGDTARLMRRSKRFNRG